MRADHRAVDLQRPPVGPSEDHLPLTAREVISNVFIKMGWVRGPVPIKRVVDIAFLEKRSTGSSLPYG
jgi:hypothetical protein